MKDIARVHLITNYFIVVTGFLLNVTYSTEESTVSHVRVYFSELLNKLNNVKAIEDFLYQHITMRVFTGKKILTRKGVITEYTAYMEDKFFILKITIV